LLGFNQLLPGRGERRVLQLSGMALFVLLALPWYVAVIANHPGLFRYFVGDEVVNRVTTDEFGRNGQWYGWIKVYVPTLLLGTLPWTPALWRWMRALPIRARNWRRSQQRAADAPALLLTLWVLLPLLVFCLARSRMPLYVLPLFLPLAVVIARQRVEEGRALPHWRWLAGWAALLLAFKFAAFLWPTHKDASAWADAIRERTGGPVSEVLFVEDMARYGVHLHLNAEVEKISLRPINRADLNPEYDETLAQELSEHEPGTVWICKASRWPELQARFAASGYVATALGTPYQERVIFKIEPRRR
jgi:hypothetical protein